MDNTDKEVKRVLEKYGEVRKKSGVWLVKNEEGPSYFVEIFDSNPKKTIKVSPIFSQGVNPKEWFRVAEARARAIQKAVLKVL